MRPNFSFPNGVSSVTDLEALRRACCESPFDMTPRLAYADELERDGPQVYAHFIRDSVAEWEKEPGQDPSDIKVSWTRLNDDRR